MQTITFKIDKQWSPTVQHRELYPRSWAEYDGREFEKKNVYVQYDWVIMLYSRNWHNTLNQLYSNTNKIKKKSQLSQIKWTGWGWGWTESWRPDHIRPCRTWFKSSYFGQWKPLKDFSENLGNRPWNCGTHQWIYGVWDMVHFWRILYKTWVGEGAWVWGCTNLASVLGSCV